MSRPIIKRSEVPVEDTWNLSELFENDEAWNAELEALKAFPEKIAAYQGKLGESAQTLLESWKLDDEVSVRLGRLYSYASCRSDEDTGNGFYQDLKGKAMGVMVAIGSAAAFVAPEIMAIEDETLEKFYAGCPELETYRRSITKLRRRKAHVLSPVEETLLAAAGEMADSPDRISGIFRDADLSYPDVLDGAGNSHELTDGTLVPPADEPGQSAAEERL